MVEFPAGDDRSVVETLAVGFFDNPLMTWIFRDEPTRAEALREWFAFWSAAYAEDGRRFTVDGDAAAALWKRPGGAPMGDEGGAGIVSIFQRWGGDDWTPTVLRGLAPLGHHPPGSFWYLNAIAVRPDGRGRGVGARLLGPMLEHADSEGVPVYLESSDPRNLTFYERHGFRPWGDAVVMPEGGPSVQPMWRDVP